MATKSRKRKVSKPTAASKRPATAKVAAAVIVPVEEVGWLRQLLTSFYAGPQSNLVEVMPLSDKAVVAAARKARRKPKRAS